MDRPKKHCFICDKVVVFYCKNIQTLRTNHTETLVYKFIEKFMGDRFNMDEINQSQILCQDCVMKLDEYDLATQTALKVESEMIALLSKKFEGRNLDDPLTSMDLAGLGGDTDALIEEIKIDECVQMEKKVFIKCNVCSKMFSNLNDLQSHTHPKSPKKKIKVEEEENVYEDIVYVDHVDFDDEEDEEYSILEDVDIQIKESLDKSDEVYDPNISIKKEKKPKAKERLTKPKVPKSANRVPLKCMVCEKEFLAKTEFRIHMKIHEEESGHICHLCGISCKEKATLDEHVALHEGYSPYTCVTCHKVFTKKGALMRHMQIHTGEKTFQCERCGKQFIHHSSFHMHQLAHDDIRKKKCTICGLLLRSNSHLTRHMRVHSGEKPYACPICGQRFAQRYNMSTHYKMHQGIHRVSNRTRKNHVCLICSATFNRKLKLDEHLAQVHKTIPPYQPTYDTSMIGENELNTSMSEEAEADSTGGTVDMLTM